MPPLVVAREYLLGAARGGGRRARTWPVTGPPALWGAAWPRAEFAVPARLREWAMAEAGAGRLLPWFAVAFGAGIVFYFTAEHEPALWAASAAAGAGIVAAVLLRRRPIAFVPALGLLAVCAGFAVATIKAALIAHPVLRYPAYSVSLAGFVTLREESQKSDRFVMRVERVEGSRIVETPERVRLSVRRGMAPPAGAFVEVKAQLEPPLQPGPRGRSFGDGGRAAALEDWCAPFAFGVARLSSASRLRNIPGIEAGFT
jgi:competence protein ComEC